MTDRNILENQALNEVNGGDFGCFAVKTSPNPNRIDSASYGGDIFNNQQVITDENMIFEENPLGKNASSFAGKIYQDNAGIGGGD